MSWHDLKNDLDLYAEWLRENPEGRVTPAERVAHRVLALYQPCPEGQGINGGSIKPADGLTVNQHNGAYLLAVYLFGEGL